MLLERDEKKGSQFFRAQSNHADSVNLSAIKFMQIVQAYLR
jgi:hypothetical protein